MTYHLSTEGAHSPSDNFPTNIRSSHSQNTDFAENVVIIETVLSKTSLPELQRKWSRRRLLPRIFYEEFNDVELGKEGINSDELLVVSCHLNPNKCYLAGRSVNLVGLDWIDELNLIQFPDENETCQTPTLEPTNAENLLGGGAATSVYKLLKSIIFLFIFSHRNQILPGLSSLLPLRTHQRYDVYYDDKFTFERV
ncbi:hypothetical protein ACTXT7_013524 [Hymenolepis weldensis]